MNPRNPKTEHQAASAQDLQALLDNSPVSSFLLDRDLRYLAFNRMHAERMREQYGASIAPGQNFLDCVSVQTERDYFDAYLRSGLEGQPSVRLIKRAIPGNPHRAYEAHLTPICAADGSVKSISVSLQEVSGQYRVAAELKQSEALYRGLFENLSSVILIIDAETHAILDANPAACAFYGYPLAHLKSIKVGDMNGWSPEELSATVRDVLSGAQNQFQLTHRLASGELRRVEVFTGPIEYQGRQALLSVVHDITERARDQQRIRETLELNQTILQSSPAAILIANAQGDCVAANPAAEQITGAPPGALLRLNMHNIESMKQIGLYEKAKMALQTGQPVAVEEGGLTIFGRQIWISGSLVPFSAAGGTHLLFMFEDVTERKHDQDLIREALNLNQNILQTSPLAILIYRADGQCISANPAASRIIGAEPDRLLAQNLHAIPVWKTNGFYESALLAIQTGKAIPIESHSATSFGRDIWVSGTFLPFTSSGEAHLMFMFEDISQRKKADLALQESEQRFRLLFESSQDSVLLTAPDGQIFSANPAAQRMFGWSEAEFQKLGRGAIVEMEDPRLPAALAERARTGHFSGELLFHRRDGSKFPGEISSTLFTDRDGNTRTSLFVHDISHRKEIENALRESEQNLRAIFDVMAEGLSLNEVVLDENGALVDFHILQANRAFYDLLKPIEPQVTGKLASQVFGIPPEIFKELLQEQKSDGGPVYTEMQSPLNGHWFMVATSPVVNGRFVSTFLDIHERKQAEQAVRASEAQYRELLDVLPAGVVLHRSGLILLTNRAAERFFGVTTPGELVGAQLNERIHPDYRNLVRARIRQVEDQSATVAWLEEKLLRTDGTAFDVEVAAMPVVYQGQPATLAAFTDISDRKQAEQALKESEERYRRLVETSPDAVYRFSNQRGGVYYSPRVKEIFGYSPEELLANPLLWHDSILPEDQPVVDGTIASFPEGANYRLEYRIRDRQGGLRWLEDRRIGSREENGEIIVEGLVTDITARKQAELDLQAAHAQLEQRVKERTADLLAANIALEKASKAKDEFLSTMSHELRTPLTGILGLAQVLLFSTYGPLNDKQIRAVQNIEKSGQHLHELINDILDLTKLQNGRIILERQPCSLPNTCRASLTMVSNLASARQQEIVFTYEPENIILNADERRLKQILINLLGNAIKFSPQGGRIELDVHGLPDQRLVRVSVRDNGIGIKTEDLPRLFQPFTQLDSALSRHYNGTGLGLSLVRNLTELHGGRVEVESEFGKGSTFTVILPWEPWPAE